jgi:DNA-binding transcriptional ArsR family regulator
MGRMMKPFDDNAICNLIRELSQAIGKSQPQKARHLLKELRKHGVEFTQKKEQGQ